jgi:hypothetical protein
MKIDAHDRKLRQFDLFRPAFVTKCVKRRRIAVDTIQLKL